MAEYNIGYERRRKTHRTIEGARTWIEDLEKKLFEQGVSGLRLSVRDTQDAVDAVAKAQGRVRLAEAVDFWLKQHAQLTNSLSVRQTYERHLAWMRDRNLRPRSIDARKNSLKPLVEEFGERKLMEVTPGEIEAFVQRSIERSGDPLSPRTIRNLKMELQAFFNWAENDKAANDGFENRLMKLETPLRDAKANEIMGAADVKKVLHALELKYPRTAVAVAVSCFAGLRSAELDQIRWEDVDFEQNEIRVRAEICKTRTSREVPIENNLLAWLGKYRLPKGRVSPNRTHRDPQRKAVCEKLGIRWPQNAARHSYGTYYAKHHGSYSQAADNMGHVGGIKMFMSAYKGYCTKADAAVYWKIEPLPVKGKVKSRRDLAMTTP